MSVLTAGETMVLLDPIGDGAFHSGMPLTLRIAGAESNFAVALSRLGVPVAWVSRLGRDPFGDVIEAALAAEGVDLRYVRRDDARTGLFAKWREDGRSRVVYYRAGSAASRLSPVDVPDEALDGVRLVHLSGITTAISASGRELVIDLARRAKERGITVVFDPNFRPALPDTPEAAAERHHAVFEHIDWYLCGLEEGNLLWGTSSAEELAAALPCHAVIRVGAEGAIVDGERVPPARQVDVRDEIGAGDAFAAGFAYGLLQGWEPRACVRAANLIAAAALAGTGDWETLPRLDDVEADLTAFAAR
jgi:2-dehydro-3-deoxygluconokinase